MMFFLNKATAISEVAKQAGMAVGSFYNYYASKEVIFLAIVNFQRMHFIHFIN